MIQHGTRTLITNDECQLVRKQKPKPAKLRTSCLDVVIVKSKEGTPYANSLQQMKSDTNLQEVGTNVRKIRWNAERNLLLKLKMQAATTTKYVLAK